MWDAVAVRMVRTREYILSDCYEVCWIPESGTSETLHFPCCLTPSSLPKQGISYLETCVHTEDRQVLLYQDDHPCTSNKVSIFIF